MVTITLYTRQQKRHRYIEQTFGLIYSFFFNFYFYFILQYCIGFAIYQNEFTTGVHEFPNLNPPSHLPPHTISLGHPSAPAPSILYPASNIDFSKTFCLVVSLEFAILFTTNSILLSNNTIIPQG